MKNNKKQVKKIPVVEYKFVDSPDNQHKIDKAYDVLFEEVFKQEKEH